MVGTLRKSLETIEDYKTANPHYTELLDIMADILILREEYMKNMTDSIFSVDEKLIAQKMLGGLPLIDLTGKEFDLKRPREYFDSLVAAAGKRMPELAQSIQEIVNDPEFDWEQDILASFDRKAEEPEPRESKEERETESHIDLVELFLEESLRPELEVIAKKYEEVVGKSEWSEDTAPFAAKSRRSVKSEKMKRANDICSAISAVASGTFIASNVLSAATTNSIPWRILKWKVKSVTGWMSAINAGVILKQ